MRQTGDDPRERQRRRIEAAPSKRNEITTPFAWAVLAGILTYGFFVRYPGLSFGFPVFIHGSEPIIVNAAINMVRTGDLNPHVFFWTSFSIYLQAMVYSTIAAIGKATSMFPTFDSIPLTVLYFWGRMLTVVLSLMTGAVVFLMGKEILGPGAGLLASLFFVTSPIVVENSYLIKADTPAMLLGLLSAWFALRILLRGPSALRFAASGLFLGFAIATRQTSVVLGLPLLVACVDTVVNRRNRKYLFLGPFVVVVATMTGFVIGSPYAIVDFESFMAFNELQKQAYGRTISGAAKTTSFVWYVNRMLSGFGSVAIAFAGLGAILWSRRRWKQVIFLLVVPAALLLLFGSFPRPYTRNLLPGLPFIAMLAGIPLCHLITRLHHYRSVRWRWVTASAVALTVIVGLGSAYANGKEARTRAQSISLPHTQWLSKIWIEENLPHGSRIGREARTAEIGLPKYWKMPTEPRVSGEHYYPQLTEGPFHVTYLGGLGAVRKEVASFDYLVINYSAYKKMMKNPERFASDLKRFDVLTAELELVKEFQPRRQESTGPVIQIYRVPHVQGADSCRATPSGDSKPGISASSGS